MKYCSFYIFNGEKRTENAENNLQMVSCIEKITIFGAKLYNLKSTYTYPDMDNLIIKRVRIERLWNKYNIDFPLDEDVNILVGDNGVGKTTILSIIIRILFDYSSKPVVFSCAQVDFSQYYFAKLFVNNDKEELVWYHNNEPIDIESAMFPLRAVALTTFDKPLYPEKDKARLKVLHDDISSDLDMCLYNAIDAYYPYKSTLGSKIRNLIKEGKLQDVNNVFHLADKAKSICEDLFKDKIWYENEETEGKLMFKTKGDGVVLKPSQLSSGEKQLLILILKTLIAQDAIALWDEPEISLHVEWQQKLIRTMRDLNPNMQLIITTHSPAILYDGWDLRALNVNDIRTEI